MRVFISDLGTTLGLELLRHCQDADIEVVGTAATKAQAAALKRRVQGHASSDKAGAVAEPVALASDKAAWSRLIGASSIVVASLADDPKLAIAMLRVHEKPRDTSDANDELDANTSDEGDGVKKFIALSSVLTWSKSATFAKATSPDGPVPHREDDFRTRKPARKYAELKTAETQVLSAHRPDELETYVVAAGLVYGGAQSSFHLVFRDAWMYPTHDVLVPSVSSGSSSAKCGANVLPMISVYDLAILTFRLASAPTPQRTNYVLAVDRASCKTTLRDVCTGVSILLATGRVRDAASADEADALLVDEDDGLVAPLQLDLSFNADEALMHELVAPDEYKHVDSGLLANLPFYVRDYIDALDLRPLRTLVLGPPRVGKTQLCRRLAMDYYVPYISLQSLVDDALSSLPSSLVLTVTADTQQPQETSSSSTSDDPVGTSPAPPDTEAPAKTVDDELEKVHDALRAWRDSDQPLHELPDAAVVDLLRWKLRSAACRNQGFVLDAVPATEALAAKVFDALESSCTDDGRDGDDSAADSEAPVDSDAVSKDAAGDASDAAGDVSDAANGDSKTLGTSRSKALLAQLRPQRDVQAPNRVIVLHAPRALLEARAQQLTEHEAQATQNSEAAFAARYEQFTTEIEALVTFFERRRVSVGGSSSSNATDGVEVLELHLATEDAYRDTEQFHDVVKTYIEQGGRAPCNFHPTRAEVRAKQRELDARRLEDDARMRREAAEAAEYEAADDAARRAAERARLELIQREETELLEARAKPLRTYLMDTVLPALTDGMLEVVQVQPDDPIDYLAEFLFRRGREMDTE